MDWLKEDTIEFRHQFSLTEEILPDEILKIFHQEYEKKNGTFSDPAFWDLELERTFIQDIYRSLFSRWEENGVNYEEFKLLWDSLPVKGEKMYLLPKFD